MERIPVRVLAAVFAVVIAVLGVAGALEVKRAGSGPFDLDAEGSIPAIASALILLCAALAAWTVRRFDPSPRRWPWVVLAVLFAVMALDEAVGVHEWLERRTGIEWVMLYLPIMLGGGVAWLAVIFRARETLLPPSLLAAGAAAWVVAAVLESVQWEGEGVGRERAVDGYGILMGIEELLEMSGSAAFALALLAIARSWAGAPGRAPVRSPAYARGSRG